MRRVVAFFVTALMVASTVRALPPTCTSGATARTHDCCTEGATLTTPPAPCCAIVQGDTQRGPVEARAIAPAPSATPVSARSARLDVVRPSHGRLASDLSQSPPSTPLYLRQISLLI